MLENALFFEKKKKKKLEKSTQTPVGLRRLVALPPDSQVATPVICSNCLNITNLSPHT